MRQESGDSNPLCGFSAGLRRRLMDSKKTLLRMEGISKSFAGTLALDDVRFELERGEVHVIAGENGAGKSTLIKILCGVHTDYTGRIVLNGEPVRFGSPQDAAEHGIAAIHQELSLVPSMSVADNIFLGREKHNCLGVINFAAQHNEGREILSRLGIDVEMERLVEEYPISLQQMIEIAKALSLNATIIIMDEPTSALTETEVERLFTTVENLKAQGHAIIYITHKMEEIYRIADRITVLRDGKYIGTAPAKELPISTLITWMVGREINDHFPRRAGVKGDEILRVEHFTVYDDPLQRPVVEDVSFAVHRGEILGIAGLRSSGSSELLNAIFGNFKHYPHGEVYLRGAPFKISTPRHSINRGIALLTNDRKTSGLVLGMMIPQNLTLASIPKYSPAYIMRNEREVKCAEHHRQALNIKAAQITMEAAELSGGNQQKITIAKWLETTPAVLLLDEPTRGIDVAAKYDIYALMNAWTSEGCAIVLITSEMPELLALSDRIIVMHRGHITARFERDEATQENILHAAMG